MKEWCNYSWTVANARYAASVVDVDAVTGIALHPNNNAARTVIAAIYIYYGFYNIAMSPLLVSYTVEILPFRIRAKGLMVMQMCVNASLVFNQYANPIAMKALDWKYYISKSKPQRHSAIAFHLLFGSTDDSSIYSQ
jgi:hypothetical protein